MLRITSERTEAVERLVLEGRLVGPWIAELRAVAEEALGRSPRVELDLQAVRFASLEGAGLLRELVDRGAAAIQGSNYVKELLRP